MRVKVSGDPHDPAATVAPEYEDCARLSRSGGVPLKRVYQEALRAYYQR